MEAGEMSLTGSESVEEAVLKARYALFDATDMLEEQNKCSLEESVSLKRFQDVGTSMAAIGIVL